MSSSNKTRCAPPSVAGTKWLCTTYSKTTAGQGMGKSPEADVIPLSITPAAGIKLFSIRKGQ